MRENLAGGVRDYINWRRRRTAAASSPDASSEWSWRSPGPSIQEEYRRPPHRGRVRAPAELEVAPAGGARVDQGERGRGTEETCVEGEVGRGLAGGADDEQVGGVVRGGNEGESLRDGEDGCVGEGGRRADGCPEDAENIRTDHRRAAHAGRCGPSMPGRKRMDVGRREERSVQRVQKTRPTGSDTGAGEDEGGGALEGRSEVAWIGDAASRSKGSGFRPGEHEGIGAEGLAMEKEPRGRNLPGSDGAEDGGKQLGRIHDGGGRGERRPKARAGLFRARGRAALEGHDTGGG